MKNSTMKVILRQPILYYIAAPAVLALWPLWLRLAYLPRTAQAWEIDKKVYAEARQLAEEILRLDPERLNYGQNDKKSGFDYSVAIDAAARNLAIPSANYTVSSKPIQRSEGQKIQECQIIIKEIDITRLAEFLSNLQVTWANLQCQKVTLTKRQGPPDFWNADLTLRYYY